MGHPYRETPATKTLAEECRQILHETDNTTVRGLVEEFWSDISLGIKLQVSSVNYNGYLKVDVNKFKYPLIQERQVFQEIVRRLKEEGFSNLKRIGSVITFSLPAK